MTTIRIAAVAVAIGLCTGSALAGCPPHKPFAGLVSALERGNGTLYLVRDGTKMPVYVGQSLCEGDILGSAGRGGGIGVQRADGKHLRITTEPKDNVIHALNGRSSVLAIIGEWLDGIIPPMEGYSIMTVGRGPGEPLAFEIRSLQLREARIAAGRSGLYVRWKGGFGPYTVTLRDGAGTAVAGMSSLPGAAAYLTASRGLAVGRWTVTVTDANGTELTGAFEVDGTRMAPAKDDGMPFGEWYAVRAALTAANDARWALESDQILYAAPEQGVDRKSIYRLIACKSYGANPPNICQ